MRAVAPISPRPAAQRRDQRPSLHHMAGRVEAERVEDGRHHVHRLDQPRILRPARRIRRRGRVVDQHGHALDAVVEQLLLAQPVVAEVVAMVGGEDDQRVLPAAEPLQRRPHPAEMRIHLGDQPLVGRPDRRDRLVRWKLSETSSSCQARNIGWAAGPRSSGWRLPAGIAPARTCMVRRRRDVGPMRLHIGQMQHEGRVPWRSRNSMARSVV